MYGCSYRTNYLVILYYLCHYVNIYTQVKSQNEKLRARLNEKEAYEKVLQKQISKAEEKYSDLNLKYENLKTLSDSKEMQDQLDSMQRKMVDVKSVFGCIDEIKIKLIQEVITMYLTTVNM